MTSSSDPHVAAEMIRIFSEFLGGDVDNGGAVEPSLAPTNLTATTGSGRARLCDMIDLAA